MVESFHFAREHDVGEMIRDADIAYQTLKYRQEKGDESQEHQF